MMHKVTLAIAAILVSTAAASAQTLTITSPEFKAGGVIPGDPKRIKEVTDIWTFAREVASRNPNWRLIATQAAN